MRERMRTGKDFTFCNDCGNKIHLPSTEEPIQLAREDRGQIEAQRRAAEQRTAFEQAIFSLQAYATERGLRGPACFISYAWGDRNHERWVEAGLASDLQKGGINVILDRWENVRIGASVSRFVSKISTCDKVIVVGTPQYREKYANANQSQGSVLAAEFDLIASRMLGTELQKETVFPLLCSGEKVEALPPLLHDRVFCDFRDEGAYVVRAFELMLSLYGISPGDPAVRDLCEMLEPGAQSRGRSLL
jgi:hypothetical protein